MPTTATPTPTRIRCCRVGFRTARRSTTAGWPRYVPTRDAPGAIALAAIAAIAVLVTIFTLMREQPAPVVSAKLPPVDMAASAEPQPEPESSARPNQPVVVSVVGLVHTPGLVTLAPGARIADALKAAGGAMDGADTIGLNMARQVDDGEQIVVGIAPVKGQPAVLGSSVSPGSAAAGPSTTGVSPGQGRPGAGDQPQHRDRAAAGRAARGRAGDGCCDRGAGGMPTASSPASTSWVRSTASARGAWKSCARWSVSEAGARNHPSPIRRRRGWMRVWCRPR